MGEDEQKAVEDLSMVSASSASSCIEFSGDINIQPPNEAEQFYL
jgi:hypothetical protein